MAEHYYSKEPVSASRQRYIEYMLPDVGRFSFVTDSGVFSISRVDHGTDILLRTIVKDAPQKIESLLDIGCGYGPIGVALGRRYPGAYVHMVDVNERAIDLARQNAAAAGLTSFAAGSIDTLDPQARYDMVVTNPPIRAGKAVVYGIFETAFRHLCAGGVLYVVIRKNQGAPSAMKELERLFVNCVVVGRESGFHILKCNRMA